MEQRPGESPADFAARFRKSQEPAPAQPAAAPPAASAPAAPAGASGVPSLLADTLAAPFRPAAVFSRLADAPAPGFGAMTLNLLPFLAAFFALNALHAALSFPKQFGAYGPLQFALVVPVAFTLSLLGAHLGAAGLHLLSLLVGAKGGYSRSFQIVSTLSLLLPAQAITLWFPGSWPAPLALGLLLTIVAVEKLHRASPALTRVLFTALMGLFIGAGLLIQSQVNRLSDRYGALLRGDPSARSAAAAQQLLESLPPGVLPPGTSPEQARQLIEQVQMAVPALSGAGKAGDARSSLEMIAGPGSGDAAPNPQITQQQAQQMAQAGANMLNSVMPLLNDPSMTKGLPPDQAAQMRQLTQIMGKLQADLQSGKPLSSEDRARLQGQLQQIMGQALQGAAPQTPPRRPPPQGGSAP